MFFLKLILGNKINQDSKSIFAASIAAICSQINPTATLPSTFPTINSNSILTNLKNSTSINNPVISEISRLLCVAQQQQCPLSKKPRLSSDIKTETNIEALSINTKNKTDNLHDSSNLINSEPSINQSQIIIPPSQLSEINVENNANATISSTSSSPRVFFYLII